MNKILTIFLGLVLVASFSVGSSVVETPDPAATDNQNSDSNPDGASNTDILLLVRI